MAGARSAASPRQDLGSQIKQAIETRDVALMSSLYENGALLRVIDRNNPPSTPREVRGKHAIMTFWDDICSRAIVHQVDIACAQDDRLAFTQNCAYPDGTKVFCMAVVDIDHGRIARQTIVQAWDE